MKIKEKVKVLAMAGVLALVGVAAVLPATDASATWIDTVNNGTNATGGSESGVTNLEDTVKNVINAILYGVGIIAVVMMILGGVQYATSAGDTAKVTKAKNTILYGIIGLVVAVLAYAIVNFVLGSLTNG